MLSISDTSSNHLLTPPKDFTYVHLESGVSTTIKDYRTLVRSSESADTEREDLATIREFVQSYFFNKDRGELVVNLKLANAFTPLKSDLNANKKDEKVCQSVIRSIAAVLNQLAITIFEVPTKESLEKKLIGLLNGSRDIDLMADSVTHQVWNRKFYDGRQQKRIDFYAINDFVFNIEKNQITLQDINRNRFVIYLKREYQDNPYVSFAIHDVLSKNCGIPLLEDLTDPSIEQVNLQEH